MKKTILIAAVFMAASTTASAVCMTSTAGETTTVHCTEGYTSFTSTVGDKTYFSDSEGNMSTIDVINGQAVILGSDYAEPSYSRSYDVPGVSDHFMEMYDAGVYDASDYDPVLDGY